MTLLIGCECSGVIRDAFRRRGVEAWSNDLKPCDPASPFAAFHIVGDVFDAIRQLRPRGLIAHPPCQFLSGSGLHWNKRTPGRTAKTEEAGQFAAALWRVDEDFDVEFVCLENPRGAMATYCGPASQAIQPWQFGDDASKETRLWLKGFPKLRPTRYRPGRIVDDGRPQLGLFGTGVERWENQTDDGQNRLGQTKGRAAKRAETYPGIGDAMGEQWSPLLRVA